MDRSPEDFTRGREGAGGGSEAHQQSTDGHILPVEEDDVKRLLKWVFFVSGAEVIDDLLRAVELHFFTEGNEGIADLRFVNTHVGRSPRSVSVFLLLRSYHLAVRLSVSFSTWGVIA
jgi:hypothetical protein